MNTLLSVVNMILSIIYNKNAQSIVAILVSGSHSAVLRGLITPGSELRGCSWQCSMDRVEFKGLTRVSSIRDKYINSALCFQSQNLFFDEGGQAPSPCTGNLGSHQEVLGLVFHWLGIVGTSVGCCLGPEVLELEITGLSQQCSWWC